MICESRKQCEIMLTKKQSHCSGKRRFRSYCLVILQGSISFLVLGRARNSSQPHTRTLPGTDLEGTTVTPGRSILGLWSNKGECHVGTQNHWSSVRVYVNTRGLNLAAACKI
jgi:hypothetical protein